MRASELRTKKDAELDTMLGDLRTKVAQLSMARNARRLEKPSELREAKRELARVLTVQKQRADAQGAQK